jgi:hypothetical protein
MDSPQTKGDIKKRKQIKPFIRIPKRKRKTPIKIKMSVNLF